jgi:hypothetical protein
MKRVRSFGELLAALGSDRLFKDFEKTGFSHCHGELLLRTVASAHLGLGGPRTAPNLSKSIRPCWDIMLLPTDCACGSPRGQILSRCGVRPNSTPCAVDKGRLLISSSYCPYCGFGRSNELWGQAGIRGHHDTRLARYVACAARLVD